MPRLFNRIDWSAFWFACAVVMGVYGYTVAPSVTLEDSGELATGGAFMGVPHPPGYPLWAVCSWIFTKLFSSVTYMGQPNPAWAIALESAFWGALAAGITALLLCRSARDIVASLANDAAMPVSESMESLMCWAGGVAGSLFFAFTPDAWSQSVIVEIYSLNSFFLALVMLLAYVWLKRPTTCTLVWLSLSFGLGLTNYQGLLIMLPALLILVLIKDLELFRDFLIAAVLYGVAIALTQFIEVGGQDYLPPIIHPTDPTCFVYMILNFLALAFIYFLLPRGKTVALCILALEIGLAIYGVMPLASEGNPPMNWAYPRTWEGFKHAITRGQYEKLDPTDVFSARFVSQVFEYMGDLRKQFTFPVAILGFVPFAAWRYGRDRRSVKMVYAAMGLAVAAGVLITIEEVLNAKGTMTPHIATAYNFIIFLVMVAMYIGYLIMCIRQAGETLKSLLEGPVSLRLLMFLGAVGMSLLSIYAAYCCIGAMVPGPTEGATIHEHTPKLAGAVFLIIAAIVGVSVAPIGKRLFAWLGSPRSELIDRISVAPIIASCCALLPLIDFKLIEKYNAITDSLTEIQKMPPSPAVDAMLREATKSATGDHLELIVLMLSPLLIPFIVWLMRGKAEVRCTLETKTEKSTDITSISWMIVVVTAFVWMSIVFMALANPKGDLQDAFIQRVKFISSHELFSFWIAYGITVGIFCVRMVFGRFMSLPAALVAVGLSAAIPILQNAYNPNLIWEVGGAEENGHDFGWQFGNYELRGAAAITEELAKDEEPLPDPQYPEEMGPDAIFFGGTDPGRFVPTYMIYSARVREDAYLITQNALADQTYMNVMRDLYGDRIWIPAQNDSAQAFHRYVEEVHNGTRQPNADLKIENGRVQVSGALGVMEINGILAQMIFEHNRYKNPFYVEESYVIGWMYPYLTPHGLIMKINHDETPFTAEARHSDMEFWDWYGRRLMHNEKFRRDVVARKSFSKLRTAIAGLYANRRMFDEAEDAFHEGRILYPLSPEANFRLAQEVLVQQRRFDYAIQILQNFGKMDPGQQGVQQFTNQLSVFSKATKDIEDIETRSAHGGISLNDSLTLTRLYIQSGRSQEADGIAKQIADNSNTPAQVLFELSQDFMNLRDRDYMLKTLDKLVPALPTNGVQPELYHQMSQMYGSVTEFSKALILCKHYLEINPADWKAWLERTYFELQLNQIPEATKSAEQALYRGGAEAQQAIEGDQRFELIRQRIMEQQQQQQRMLNMSGGIGGSLMH